MVKISIPNCKIRRVDKNQLYLEFILNLNSPYLFEINKIKRPCSTVIFHGQKDKICAPKLTELTRQGISQSRIVHFEGSGHAMMFEEPEKFNEELLQFLEQARIPERVSRR